MKNAKEVLAPLLASHMAFEKANADGKIDFNDIQHVIAPLSMIPAALQDAPLALEELKNASEEERKQLHAELAAMYDIADDVLEAKVEAAVEFLMALGKFAGVLVAKPAEPVPSE